MKTKIFIILLIIFLSEVCVKAINLKADSIVTINIRAKDYRNVTIWFNYSPTIRPSIILDSNGNGTINIKLIKDQMFVSFQTSDTVFFNLFAEVGYNIVYTINKTFTKIEGEGSSPNNYRLLAQSILKNFSHSTKTIKDEIIEPFDFIDLAIFFELKLKAFHEHFMDSIRLPDDVAYIVRKSVESTMLLAKQRYLLSLDERTIDSLNLYDRLGLLTNDIFSDTLLFKLQYIDFMNFLIHNFDQTTGNNIYNKYPDPSIYPIVIFSEVCGGSKYSEPIKEYLLYANLASELYEIGIHPTIENLCEVYYNMYPANRYTTLLKNLYLKFNALSNGNVAPQFSGKTVAGQTISLNDFKGKVLLIDVWATWCGPCKTQLPYTHKLQKTFEKEKGVAVLYVSIDSRTTEWKTFLTKNKWLTGLHINIDDKKFIESYKITGVPRYILIDKNGNIINAFCDKPSKGTIEDEIRKAL